MIFILFFDIPVKTVSEAPRPLGGASRIAEAFQPRRTMRCGTRMSRLKGVPLQLFGKECSRADAFLTVFVV